jgi:hypothetical protein
MMPMNVDKGAEMGRFNMGSTVILVFPREYLKWRPDQVEGARIRVGQTLASLLKHPETRRRMSSPQPTQLSSDTRLR